MRPDLLSELGPGSAPQHEDNRDSMISALRSALARRSPRALLAAESSLLAYPTDPELLLLCALTAIASGKPERALVLLKRYGKRYVPNEPATVLTALALGHQEKYGQALSMLRADKLDTDRAALQHFVGDVVMADWFLGQIREIRRLGSLALRQAPKPPRQADSRSPAKRTVAKPRTGAAAPVAVMLPTITGLPRLEARFDMAFEIANPDAIEIAGAASRPVLRSSCAANLIRLSLFEGFDELLCLPALQGVEAHWYQVETVRKVLKQYRGRVLLADEVGLGKTVEAGMVLKEYILRGMAERILILTPASLVGQWRDEMAAKFGIDCATSHDPLLRSDPAAFWAQPRVIASIAAARRKEQAEMLAGLNYDVVVVDEAHHLRDQSSASYQLVNRLAEALPAAAVGDAGAEQPAGAVQPADPAAARHLQDAEGIPLGLHGARQAARAGEPGAAARPDARRDGAQHPRAGGAAHAAAACLDACAPHPIRQRPPATRT